MGLGSSDLVRAVALEKYVQPAIRAGKTKFSVAVKDIMQDLQGKGFPRGNYPQICTAIRAGKFLRENRIEIEYVDGPPSGQSPKVVVHYRVATAADVKSSVGGFLDPPAESSEAKAERLTQKLRGLLKEELAEFGGAESFIRWIRSENENDK